MHTIKRPDWFLAASENLEKIENNLEKYENDERIRPSAETIASVKTFLKAVFTANEEAVIAEPKLFVSPNGQVVATLGDRPQCLSVTFSPDISFIFRHPEFGVIKGIGLECPVKIALEHFRTR